MVDFSEADLEGEALMSGTVVIPDFSYRFRSGWFSQSDDLLLSTPALFGSAKIQEAKESKVGILWGPSGWEVGTAP